jgi:hypothetical protein
MWTIQWEGFRAWLGLTNYRISGRLPPLAAAAHGKGKGETVSVPVDLGVVWGCRWLLLVLRLWVCGVLVGGMGGAGRREQPSDRRSRQEGGRLCQGELSGELRVFQSFLSAEAAGKVCRPGLKGRLSPTLVPA